MTTVLLVRHGRTTANADGTLAGWTPGVMLDELGREQAAAIGERLRDVPLTLVVSSPLDRCRETTERLLMPRASQPEVIFDESVGEAHYGDWTGKKLSELAEDPHWPVVQAHASAAVFPGEGGESMAAMSARAIDGVRRWSRVAQDKAGDSATLMIVSHGDVIKAIVADALGLHLDLFQRIQVDPCSLSVIRYTKLRPFVERLNDKGGSVAGLIPAVEAADQPPSSDAAVGGGAGA
jgi:probable phosphomutase (TIGR03848 family)